MLNAQAEILISNQAARQFLQLPDLGEGTPVFGHQGVICQEDGTPLTPTDLPVQRAIAQRAPLDDVVIGIRAQTGTPEVNPLRWLLVNVDPQLNKTGDVEQVVCTC